MKQVIMIKYGELTTKKDNIGLFLNTLKKNIDYVLKGFNVQIEYDKGRMFIISNDDNYDQINGKLKNVFGIHEFILAYKLEDNDLDIIGQNILSLIKDKEVNTFKV